jgi:hypothetical protein
MHSTHVAMSPQSAIAFVHVPLSKFGHVSTSPHPLSAIAGSSDVPHVTSSPPHAVAMTPSSDLPNRAIRRAVRGSLTQSVLAGSRPMTLRCSQRCSAVALRRKNVADASAMAR